MLKNLGYEIFYSAEIIVISSLFAVIAGTSFLLVAKSLAAFAITGEPTFAGTATAGGVGFLIGYVSVLVFVARPTK